MILAAAQENTFSSPLMIDFWGIFKSNFILPSNIKKSILGGRTSRYFLTRFLCVHMYLQEISFIAFIMANFVASTIFILSITLSEIIPIPHLIFLFFVI